MRRLFQRNGLSIVLITLFLISLAGQSIVGHRHYNHEQQEHQQPKITYLEYVTGSHFLEATMENWESEFLQMFFFIVLTIFLYQKGSAESKDPDKEEEVDQDSLKAKKKNSPSPVKKGGWRLKLYEHSLSLTFLLLFLASFFLHAKGGATDYNEEQAAHGSDRIPHHDRIYGHVAFLV